MDNFYLDNADIQFHMEHLDLERVVSLREDDYAEKDAFPDAPVDLDDARDNYARVMKIIGEIAGDFIAPRAEDVDRQGATFADGEVTYAKGTQEAIDRLTKADLMGFTLPRRYGGLNLPKTVYSMAIEMVSRADASLMNLFGLQEIAETIYRFGTEDQCKRFLPRFCSGEVSGAMALTEPDAGSDLQAVMLKATEASDGTWRLNGVKRFITNGCAEISLVMARSEDGSTGGRGLSLFIYERDEHLKIRRIEHKLGIHGSPTCEIQFNDAPSELLGRRKFGLVKYTMALMNGARLGVAAQAVGIAEAAYREAAKYANDRIQFKKTIRNFSAIFEMLTDMKVDIEIARCLLYETSRVVDIKEGLEDRIEHHPELAKDLKEDLSRYNRFAALLTPMIKAFAAEMSNKVTYDAIQVHGGVGFTTEFPVERLYRDARITNIYEGTTQLQVVATIGGVIGGVVTELLNQYEQTDDLTPAGEFYEKAKQIRNQMEAAVAYVKELGDSRYQEYHAARLVQMATDAVNAYLICRDAMRSKRKEKVAQVFFATAMGRVSALLDRVRSGDQSLLECHTDIIDFNEGDACFLLDTGDAS